MLCQGYAAKDSDPAKQRGQLVMLKAGLATPFAGNESTRIGQIMERVLFAPLTRELLSDDGFPLLGWTLEPFGMLVEDAECSSLAATPDFLVHTPWGTGVVQTKDTTAQAQEDCKATRKDGKPSEAAYAQGAPLYYELQLQAELACTGLEWGCLLVLHAAGGGKKLRPYASRRHEGVIARLRSEAVSLMVDVERLRRGENGK